MVSFESLPKIELHRHLDCSMRFSTMVEICRTLKIPIPQDEKKQKDFLLIKTPQANLKDTLAKFNLMQNLFSSYEILERLAFECVEDSFLDGIRLLELRYAPSFIRGGKKHLKPERIMESFAKGVSEAQKTYPVGVGFIGILQRTLSAKENSYWLDFFLAYPEHFIAVDLADNELEYPLSPFVPLFQRAQKAGLGITLHAGEVPGSSKNVIEAVQEVGAIRLGHGIETIKNPMALKLVLENKVHLEVCPSSNILTGSVMQLSGHPVKDFWQKGVSFSLNTDDPGMFDLTLSKEYQRLAQVFNWTLEDFKKINQMAFHASFIKNKNDFKNLFFS